MPDDLFQQVVDALRTIDFDERYYGYYQRIRSHTRPSGLSKQDWVRALAETGVQFRYHAKERFFSSEKQIGECEVILRIAFRYDDVELILALQTPKGDSGGPFTLLAYSVGVSRDRNFSPKPPYPTLPFSNAEQLRDILHFAMTLYADIERALLASAICGEE